ncbi:MAG: putative ABC transporter permease, partial [Faecalispora jeddahensis]
IGAVLLEGKSYILQFVIFTFAATVIEYLCGALLKYGLHMRAWDYSKEFLNIDGIISPAFTVVWGLAGLAFSNGSYLC